MLNAVYDRLPDLYPYCISAYSQPSVLFYGSFILMSNEGPQQGDPLAPLLFSNTVQPLLLSRQTGLVLGFLDDFSLDHQNQVARDVQQIIEVGVRMGLSLNVSKCEVIADPATTITDPLLQSFERIATQDAILVHRYFWVQILSLDNAWAERCADFSRAVNRLSLLSSQEALCLLRASFSVLRVQHL